MPEGRRPIGRGPIIYHNLSVFIGVIPHNLPRLLVNNMYLDLEILLHYVAGALKVAPQLSGAKLVKIGTLITRWSFRLPAGGISISL